MLELDDETRALLAGGQVFGWEDDLRTDSFVSAELRDADRRASRDFTLSKARCAYCGGGMHHKKRRHATTCSAACRVALHRHKTRMKIKERRRDTTTGNKRLAW